MNSSTATPSDLAVTPQQQHIIDRIVAQRERLQARWASARNHKQGGMLRANAQEAAERLLSAADASLAIRLLAFARLHPWATAAAVAVAVAAGPARLVRWGGVVLPLVLGLLRGHTDSDKSHQ